MTPKTKTKRDDAVQSKRFIETAKELEVDENPEAFERAFKKVVPQKKPSAKRPS